MTHYTRPSFTLYDTTFHFVDGRPPHLLGEAARPPGGKDVRLGGGVSAVRQFLDADLVDTLHVVVSPMTLGAGPGCGSSPDELLDRLPPRDVPSPSGVVHHLFWRK